jgi:predicted DNA-binding transcriptional regulator YafY
MQISRLFEIVYLLLDRRVITAKELAEHFEVSVRTIYRDIEMLSAAGVPVYASQGKGGGIRLMEHYVLNKSILSDAEQKEVLYALQSLTAAQHSDADRVLSKLSGLFHTNAESWIEVDLAPWGSSKRKTEEFTALKNAILGRRITEFGYVNSSGDKSIRRVEPLKLIFKVNAWYLQGFCLDKKELRTFKLSRMSDMEVTEVSYPARTPEELREPESAKPTQQWVDLKLRFSPRGTYRVYDEFKEQQITRHEDGSCTVDTSLPESSWLIHYLLSFGAELEVLSPPHIRSSLQAAIMKVLERYSQIT